MAAHGTCQVRSAKASRLPPSFWPVAHHLVAGAAHKCLPVCRGLGQAVDGKQRRHLAAGGSGWQGCLGWAGWRGRASVAGSCTVQPAFWRPLPAAHPETAAHGAHLACRFGLAAESKCTMRFCCPPPPPSTSTSCLQVWRGSGAHVRDALQQLPEDAAQGPHVYGGCVASPRHDHLGGAAWAERKSGRQAGRQGVNEIRCSEAGAAGSAQQWCMQLLVLHVPQRLPGYPHR